MRKTARAIRDIKVQRTYRRQNYVTVHVYLANATAPTTFYHIRITHSMWQKRKSTKSFLSFRQWNVLSAFMREYRMRRVISYRIFEFCNESTENFYIKKLLLLLKLLESVRNTIIKLIPRS